jgi:hypothetical protein
MGLFSCSRTWVCLYSVNAWLRILVHTVLRSLLIRPRYLWPFLFCPKIQIQSERLSADLFRICSAAKIESKQHSVSLFLVSPSSEQMTAQRISYNEMLVRLCSLSFLWGLNYAIRAVQAKQAFVFIGVALKIATRHEESPCLISYLFQEFLLPPAPFLSSQHLQPMLPTFLF